MDQIKPPWTDLLLKAGLPLLILIPIVLALIYWFWLAPPPGRRPAGREGEAMAGQPSEGLAVRESVYYRASRRVSSVSAAGWPARPSALTSVKACRVSTEGIQVKDTFQMIPWPFCEVLDLLEPLKKRNEEQAFGLTASLNKPGDPPLYYNNEHFSIEVKTPTKFESYVYVDYYSTDETVGHLFPNTEETIEPPGAEQIVHGRATERPAPLGDYAALRARSRDGDRQQSATLFTAKA